MHVRQTLRPGSCPSLDQRSWPRSHSGQRRHCARSDGGAAHGHRQRRRNPKNDVSRPGLGGRPRQPIAATVQQTSRRWTSKQVVSRRLASFFAAPTGRSRRKSERPTSGTSLASWPWHTSARCALVGPLVCGRVRHLIVATHGVLMAAIACATLLRCAMVQRAACRAQRRNRGTWPQEPVLEQAFGKPYTNRRASRMAQREFSSAVHRPLRSTRNLW